jgi:xanthine dehydrogenase small subunit
MTKAKKQNLEEPYIFINSDKISIGKVDNNISVLNFLRNNKKLVGTKEGCSEGDCGACSILISDKDGGFNPINSCILKIGQVIGESLITIEGVAKSKAAEKLVTSLYEKGASQCGFCTPGFVIASTALKNNFSKTTEKQVHDALSGNLCRCTGYRPIIDAILDVKGKVPLPKAIRQKDRFHSKINFGKTSYLYPRSLNDLKNLLSSKRNFVPLAGGTDWNLERADQDFSSHEILFLNGLPEITSIKKRAKTFEVGASVTLQAFENFCLTHYPSLSDTLNRFGSPQIRSAATIGGNLATSSPIGDLAPIFLALDASLQLLSKKGIRRVSIKQFFLGYRKNRLKPKEIIFKLELPKLKKSQKLFSWKLSKRYDQDISTISLAGIVDMSKVNIIKDITLAAGGVAAVPIILKRTSQSLKNRNINNDVPNLLLSVAKDISPISDLRGTAEYRETAMNGLLRKMTNALKDNIIPQSIMQF